jgi:hypothetical protein
LRALREAKAHAALNSRLSNRRQRTQGSDLGPLSHLRGHRGSYLARGQRFEERQVSIAVKKCVDAKRKVLAAYLVLAVVCL